MFAAEKLNASRALRTESEPQIWKGNCSCRHWQNLTQHGGPVRARRLPQITGSDVDLPQRRFRFMNLRGFVIFDEIERQTAAIIWSSVS